MIAGDFTEERTHSMQVCFLNQFTNAGLHRSAGDMIFNKTSNHGSGE